MDNISDFFLKGKVNLNLFKFSYPEFIASLNRIGGSLDFVEKHYSNTGKKIGKYMGERWDKKYKNISSILKDVYKLFGSKKFKIKKIRELYSIIDYNCFICWKKLELPEFHYCMILSGFFEEFLKQVLIKNDIPYKDIIAETVKSVSSGDRFCKHEVRIKY